MTENIKSDTPFDSEWENISWDNVDFGDANWGLPSANVDTKIENKIAAPEIHLLSSAPADDYKKATFDRYEADIIKREGIVPGVKDEASRETMYFIYSNLGANNDLAVKALVKANTDQINMIKSDIDEFAEFFDSLPSEKRKKLKGQIGNVLVSYVDTYDEVFSTRKLREDIFKRLENIENPFYNEMREVADSIEIAKQSGSDKYFAEFYDYYMELKNSDTDTLDNPKGGNAHEKRSMIFRSYCRNHGLNDETVDGFRESLFPAIDAGDPEMEPLLIPSNSWGTSIGEYGIADFIVAAKVSRVTPRNTRDIMQINRLIPTGDYTKYEQNRRDAIALVGTFWTDRSFIHDERPGLNKLYTAMTDMYDAYKSNDGTYEEKRKKLQNYINEVNEHESFYQWAGFKGDLVLDIDNYDKKISRTVNDSMASEDYDMKAIDIIRRLRNNSEVSLLERPVTGNDELDKILSDIYIHPNKADGTVNVDFKETCQLVAKMNQILKDSQGKIGMQPSMVHALSFTEKVTTFAMRNLSKNDYKELPFDPGFKEIVRFLELTSSPSVYSESGFERFYQGFINDCSKSWNMDEEPDYSKTVMHEMSNVANLAKQYRDEGKSSYMIDSLWSGNLVHELIGLSDSK